MSKDTVATLHDANPALFERRRQAIEAEWQQMLDDVDHWNRMHPDQPPIVIEPITHEEIEALKNAKR